jgi:hypothetical protein
MVAKAPPTKVGHMPDGGPYNLREGYTWTGICLCGFVTTGWPTKKQAKIRIDQHSREHEDTSYLMPPKEEVEQETPKLFPVRDGELLPSRNEPPLWGQMMAAIVAADINFRGSTTAGAAGNSTAYGGADTGLGKYATNNNLADATLNAMFSDATGAENAASTIHYQCMFVYNANAANAFQTVAAWLSAEVAGGATVALAADSTAASAVGSASAQALQIANRTTAPAGPLTFTSPTTFGTGVALGTIPTTNVKGLWVRRTLANTAALNADGMTISVQGDTAAA